MKIGILTLPFNNNYGGLLQAYALYCYLSHRGNEVFSIQQTVYQRKNELNGFIKRKLQIGTYVNSINMEKFQHRFLQKTIPVRTDKNLEKLNQLGFDAIIVGSDQVWRFKYTKEKYQRYFLDFIKDRNIKKMAYAASFGVDNWEANKEQTKIAAQLINKFDAVSVREKTGVDLCRNFLCYNSAINLLDPTLLMEPDFYRGLYTGKEMSNKEKIGYYFLDDSEDRLNFLCELENRLNLSSFCIGKQKIVNRIKGKSLYYPSVSQWIKDFDEAAYIITDSYHGMIFSIIFRKPFLVVGNKKRGLSRFSSFLKMMNMEDRLLIENNIESNYKKNDYKYPLKIIKEMREKSKLFFENYGL